MKGIKDIDNNNHSGEKGLKKGWYKYKSKTNLPRNEREFVIGLLDMIENDALRYRISNLVMWYIDQAEFNKRSYLCLNLITIVSNAAIPVINIIYSDVKLSIINCGLAAMIGLSLGINNLFHFKDNWTRYRKSAEKIKQAMSDFTVGVQRYKEHDNHIKSNDTPMKESEIIQMEILLEKEIRKIISAESIDWFQLNVQEDKTEKE